jgi:uncharacterized protein (TIGR02145 family)
MKTKYFIPLLFIFTIPLFFSCEDEEVVHNVTNVTLSKTTVSIIEGESEALTAAIAPTNASNKKVEWKSSDEAIATVDPYGKVHALKAGSTAITVTTEDGNKTATCTVTIVTGAVVVDGISLDKISLTLDEGLSEYLAVTIAPMNATNKKFSWKSSDDAVATVEGDGKVTAHKAGNATITLTTDDGNKTATCNVTVKAVIVAVTGVSLDKTSMSLVQGNSRTLTATITPVNATNKKVEWKSSDYDIATVDSNGKVTAVKAGTATITATTEDSNKTATCSVKVFDAKNAFTDSRDDNVYSFVTIGEQVWMSENLKYLPSVVGRTTDSNSAPYYYVSGYNGTDVSEAKATSNYEIYGVLYNWPAAINACPSGWHLPSDAEWTQLTTYLGGEGGAGARLKATGTVHEGTGLWNSPNTGASNQVGFTALPGGNRNAGDAFFDLGNAAYWWSATESSATNAWRRAVYRDQWHVNRNSISKEIGLSVRCVRD